VASRTCAALPPPRGSRPPLRLHRGSAWHTPPARSPAAPEEVKGDTCQSVLRVGCGVTRGSPQQRLKRTSSLDRVRSRRHHRVDAQGQLRQARSQLVLFFSASVAAAVSSSQISTQSGHVAAARSSSDGSREPEAGALAFSCEMYLEKQDQHQREIYLRTSQQGSGCTRARVLAALPWARMPATRT